MERRAVDEYLQKDEPQIEERQERWGHWTSGHDALRERQRRFRLLTKTKPRELAHPNSDPLELAWEALQHLVSVRQGLKSNVRAREHLDQAEELVRQLGWGPEPAGLAQASLRLRTASEGPFTQPPPDPIM